jgi:pimeloyl-ACP methyl ester carboxylesterase
VKLFDAGSGFPIIVVPGIPGRWEWMTPGLQALVSYGRVISYSLCGEPGSGWPLPVNASFDAHVGQLDSLLDHLALERAVVCGVSLGGWIALRYAACRPSRVAGLVLASTPGPRFTLDPQQRRYVGAPMRLAPHFMASARRRLQDEIERAIPDRITRWAFTRDQLVRIARAPASPRRMARRITSAAAHDFARDCCDVRTATLVLTGEKDLDRVVPVESSREYLTAIAGARDAVVPHTGHLAVVTRPEQWARTIGEFMKSGR